MSGARLRDVRAQVAAACREAGRAPESVHLIAVSKTEPVDALQEAYDAGQRHFGESYAQELRDKARRLHEVQWHFIGRIQKNKVKYIAPVAHRIHSLETVAQAEALAKRAPDPLKCLLSVNIAHQESKSGTLPRHALDRCKALQAIAGIEMVGLMCLPPFDADPEASSPWFEEIAALAASGRDDGLALTELSMGMSNDFPVAIRHGATWIRVGTAIFGPRLR